MTHAKKILAILIAALVPFAAITASAQAAGETVSAQTTLSPRSGDFYKEAGVSSNLAIDVLVTPGAGPTVLPTKNIKLTFPSGMTFKPNANSCPNSKLGPGTNLALGPKYMADQCPKAIVGTGTAVIYLSKFKAAPLPDPVLIAFNGGKNSSGQPILKIYGFSKQTGVGILMTATLKGRVLDIAIPVLSSDSAIGQFHLDIPGGTLNRPELNLNVKGLDPNYVQAKCSASPLTTAAVFEMGERDVSTGAPTSPTVTVNAPETGQSCNGLAGKAKLGAKVNSGPKTVKSGRKGTFKINVKNNGTATAKNVVVTATGGGKAKGGNIAPGASKTITVKTTVRGKKNSKATVKFTAKAGNIKAMTSKKVTVK